MIINPTMFLGTRKQPYSAKDTGEYTEIVQSISDYENEFLYMVLGEMASDYIDGLNQTTILQKWIDLRDGVQYEIDGKTRHFEGLSSLTTYYVAFYHTFKTSQSSNIGEVQIQPIVSNNKLRANIWNEMVDAIQSEEIYHFSLKTFLENYKENDELVYTDWKIKHFEYKNRFGI